MSGAVPLKQAGLLGDTAERDYSGKLQTFNAFAEPELRAAIRDLNLEPGMRILDAGCGAGEALRWFAEECGGSCEIIGVDLSAAHGAKARALNPAARVLQADLTQDIEVRDLDLVWCVNTINHLRDPHDGARRLASLLKPGARLALGQSSLVPDMYFAWDARLERVTNEAVRHYYRDRYGLRETDLKGVRSLLGVMRRAELRNVRARTRIIERTSPLDLASRNYLFDTIFRNTWGPRLRPYLEDADYAELSRLCDADDPAFALNRPDFHFLQSFTVVTGET